MQLSAHTPAVALLAGSGYNASCVMVCETVCNGLAMVAADCNKVREDVARSIYLYFGQA